MDQDGAKKRRITIWVVTFVGLILAKPFLVQLAHINRLSTATRLFDALILAAISAACCLYLVTRAKRKDRGPNT